MSPAISPSHQPTSCTRRRKHFQTVRSVTGPRKTTTPPPEHHLQVVIHRGVCLLHRLASDASDGQDTTRPSSPDRTPDRRRPERTTTERFSMEEAPWSTVGHLVTLEISASEIQCFRPQERSFFVFCRIKSASSSVSQNWPIVHSSARARDGDNNSAFLFGIGLWGWPPPPALLC